MVELDAAALAEKALHLGLLTSSQLQEGWAETGQDETDPHLLVRALERKGHLTPWQSSKLLKGDDKGYALGGYNILYRIASGTFGRVFRAEDPATHRVVAIKVLRRKWEDDPHNIELFEREGRVGMSLRHPNVVEILSVSRDAATRQYYIVMEFVEGGNLRDFLGIRKKLEAHEALRILQDCVAGLTYAYSRGVSHRDIKLTNILISAQGTVKLVDFGLAGLYGRHKEQDQTRVDRTVDYAGLERATGTVAGDIRSDIYFLGCVTYEMLTGRSPLEMTPDARARMSRHRFLQAESLRHHDINGPESLVRLVNTMMALNPNQRHQTPAQLLEAVKEVSRHASGQPGGAPQMRTVFVVEKDERLQNLLREKLKARGFKVLLAADARRALDRFRSQPFDALILHAASGDADGLLMFNRIMDEAEHSRKPCCGILMLPPDLAVWQGRVPARLRQHILHHPVKFKQLLHKLEELLA